MAQAWRAHTSDLRSVRAAVNSQVAAEGAVLLRVALRGWLNHTAQRRVHRAHILERCVDKRVASLQGSAFAAWRHYTQVRSACCRACARKKKPMGHGKSVGIAGPTHKSMRLA